MNTHRKISVFLSVMLMAVVSYQAEAKPSSDQKGNTSAAKQSVKDEFPGRKLYSHVPYITIKQLNDEYYNTVIVDARSSFEYETLRIASAVNIPLSLDNIKYKKELLALREANPGKKIVFYCNGHTCMKSYKATYRAKVIAKLDDVYAFDAGIFDWTKAHPDKAVLLGQTPVDPSKLISKSKLKKHTLPAAEFIEKSTDKAIILDVRSRHQRDGFYVFSRYEESISMEDKASLKKFIKKAKAENKTLFIYDAVGKQVRWLQYYLEQQNAGPYYFMKGGAQAFFDIPENQFNPDKQYSVK